MDGHDPDRAERGGRADLQERERGGWRVEIGIVVEELTDRRIRAIGRQAGRIGPRDPGQWQGQVDGGLREQAGGDEQGHGLAGTRVQGFGSIGSRPDARHRVQAGGDRRPGRAEIGDRRPVVPDLGDDRSIEWCHRWTQGEPEGGRDRRVRRAADPGPIGQQSRECRHCQRAEADASRHDHGQVDRQRIPVEDEDVARTKEEHEGRDPGPERGQPDEDRPRSALDEHDDAQGC